MSCKYESEGELLHLKLRLTSAVRLRTSRRGWTFFARRVSPCSILRERAIEDPVDLLLVTTFPHAIVAIPHLRMANRTACKGVTSKNPVKPANVALPFPMLFPNALWNKFEAVAAIPVFNPALEPLRSKILPIIPVMALQHCAQIPR